ncbi:hypothetical protein ACHAXT_012518 [Thalassiosira profunda]
MMATAAVALLLLLLPLGAAFSVQSQPLATATSLGLLDAVDQSILATFTNVDGASPVTPQTILENVDRAHERDVSYARGSPLPFESTHPCPIEYEPAKEATSDATIAIRTKATPLLNEEEIRLLQKAVECYWARDGADEAASRFTYQRKGNSEAHLSDVVRYSQQSSTDISSLVNDLLLQRIYPWVRDAYLSKEEESKLTLHVYDSLFIRYNATEANADNTHAKSGAGQPLHRDLGFVSVNVMLNSPDEFVGGGTFFESQLLGDAEGMRPLKPLGPGHALAHFSSDRHAGAATSDGVRDILVIFLAAAENHPSSSGPRTAPRWERNARLKAAARAYCSECTSDALGQLACRILSQRLAIDQVPNDGEAWQYLGMALLEYNDLLQAEPSAARATINGGGLVELAVSCLEEASKHTPCDGRLYNNLGIALERLLSVTDKAAGLDDRIRSAYQHSIDTHFACKQAGCDVDADFASASLNYGLYLSKLDLFEDAISVLSRIAPQEMPVAEIDAARQRVVRDAMGLLSFCERQSRLI